MYVFEKPSNTQREECISDVELEKVANTSFRRPDSRCASFSSSDVLVFNPKTKALDENAHVNINSTFSARRFCASPLLRILVNDTNNTKGEYNGKISSLFSQESGFVFTSLTL